MKEEVILTILPHQLREVLKRENIDFQSIQEIRLRVGKPLILLYRGNEVIPKADGRPYYITKDEIREMLDYISGYSLYSYEREMSQGYITIEGGHRVGLSGQAIMENGKVKNLKYIFIDQCENVNMKYLDVQMDYCLILLSTGDYIIHFLSRLRVVERRHYFGI